MSEEWPCPKEGCPFKSLTKNGTVMHYLNKPDHTDMTTKPEVYAAIESVGPVGTPDTDPSPVSEPETIEYTEPDPADSPKGVRLSLGGMTDPEPVEGCPSCGEADWWASGDVLKKYGGRLSAEERKALRANERVCVDCFEVY